MKRFYSLIRNRVTVALAVIGPVAATMTQVTAANPTTLWYDEPATKWVEALPVGNSRVSAMIFGGVNEERLQLNEGTLWPAGRMIRLIPRQRKHCRRSANW